MIGQGGGMFQPWELPPDGTSLLHVTYCDDDAIYVSLR
jgi:hypothetical protein